MLKNSNYQRWFSHNKSLGLLILRLAIGVIMLMHGIQKFQDLNGTIMFFSHLGSNVFWAWIVSLVETLGGAALILGVWTQIAASLIAIEMLTIILWLNWGKAFSHYNLEFTILAASLAITLMGAGKYSLSKKCSSCKECDCMCHRGDKRCGEGMCKGCGCK